MLESVVYTDARGSVVGFSALITTALAVDASTAGQYIRMRVPAGVLSCPAQAGDRVLRGDRVWLVAQVVEVSTTAEVVICRLA